MQAIDLSFNCGFNNKITLRFVATHKLTHGFCRDITFRDDKMFGRHFLTIVTIFFQDQFMRCFSFINPFNGFVRMPEIGETIEVMVKGMNLTNVNALSFALPYNQQDYEYEGVRTLNTASMENFTNDRLHSDGSKVLYPTFVNVGNKPALNGSENLFIIKFKAKQKVAFDLKPADDVLVNKELAYINF